MLGERLAADYLRRRGYDVIETNYRCPEGEIDIVARQGGDVVFVEVRTRRGQRFGTPEESVTSAKMEHLRLAAASYLAAHGDLAADWRIDFVAVELDERGKTSRISLIENAVGDS